jgi:hypothetical protein
MLNVTRVSDMIEKQQGERKMYKEMAIFRKAHGIEYTLGDLHSNINDEVTEALREIFSGNILALVGEFCDITIFVGNGLEQLGHDAKSNIEQSSVNAIIERHPTPIQAIAGIKKAHAHFLINKDMYSLALIANIAMSAIDSLGYHAEACVTEKAICNNSREGSNNLSTGKWEKDENQCPSTLYKPQYEKCKK